MRLNVLDLEVYSLLKGQLQGLERRMDLTEDWPTYSLRANSYSYIAITLPINLLERCHLITFDYLL